MMVGSWQIPRYVFYICMSLVGIQLHVENGISRVETFKNVGEDIFNLFVEV